MLAKVHLTDGQCGIGRLYRFRRDPNDNALKDELKNYEGFIEIKGALKFKDHRGGTGFFGTGFVNDSICKDMYEELCKTHRLVFQTPVRMNLNSDNNFFYAMWDDDEKDDIATIQPNWPFKNE